MQAKERIGGVLCAGIWLSPIADERVGVQVKLCDPLRTSAIPERLCSSDSLRRGAISSVCTFTFYRRLSPTPVKCTKRHGPALLHGA